LGAHRHAWSNSFLCHPPRLEIDALCKIMFIFYVLVDGYHARRVCGKKQADGVHGPAGSMTDRQNDRDPVIPKRLDRRCRQPSFVMYVVDDWNSKAAGVATLPVPSVDDQEGNTDMTNGTLLCRVFYRVLKAFGNEQKILINFSCCYSILVEPNIGNDLFAKYFISDTREKKSCRCHLTLGKKR
jgi:hypothetical protein